MSNIPETLAEFIPWAVEHRDRWTTNQTQIGISAPQALAFKTLVDALTTASGKAEGARQTSKSATMDLSAADHAARAVAGAYVNLIKAFAVTSNNPNVYGLAGLSPDAPPGTLPAPTPPTKFTATLNSDGSLTIRWKAAQPTGVANVVYQVTRRLAGEKVYTPIGSAGSTKKFEDKTIPFGTDQVSYIVTPARGNVVGAASDVFDVQFGSVGGGGFAIASTSETSTTTKLAA